jgi:hypothetical protein
VLDYAAETVAHGYLELRRSLHRRHN